MDILEEIDETIQDKKREWNYRPMREKNETDALIDELLKEFSAGNTQSSNSYSRTTVPQRDYNQMYESEERMEYEQDVRQSYSSQQVQHQFAQPVQHHNSYPNESDENDMTQVFSRKDIEEYEKNQQDNESFTEYNGSQNDEYSGNGGFDDDYYDENDFEDDCESLQPEDLDEEEYAEFENYMTAREEQKNRNMNSKTVSMPKRILKILYTAVIAAFTIIGIFSSALYILEQFEASPDDKKAQDEALKTEIASVVYPVVATQTDDFPSADEIPDEQLIAVSIWEIIINGDLKIFTDSESGDIVIPHSQVEYAVSKLFGSEKNVDACDIEVDGIEIKYDKDSKSYIIPENHDIYTSYPVVAAIDQQGETYNVSVKYYNDGPQWITEKKSSPEKTVVYTLKKTSDYYNIVSAITAE